MKSKIWLAMGMLSLPTAANAQYRHYDGPPVDIHFETQKPAKYAVCDKYLHDTTARRYAACEFGRDEAERMAVRFGGGNGKIQGYLRGFAWGMHKMSEAYENDASEMLAGEKLVSSIGSTMQAGLDAGIKSGTQQGTPRGMSDAISRFEGVVNKGIQPDSKLTIPTVTYAGEKDAYQKFVGPVPTSQQIIQNEVKPGELQIYSTWDDVFLGEKKPTTVWDLWFSDGVYQFEKAYWYDQQLAMQTWFKRPIDTRPKYDQLNIPALVDTSGQTVDLQAVFRDAFISSYAYYVNYNFSSEFRVAMDDGMLSGQMIGTQVGKRVAQYKGLVRAYNDKFLQSSLQTFQAAFGKAYTDSFNATFADYNNNPKLSIELKQAIGADNDGILQPGEEIALELTIRNSGNKPTPLSISIGGNIIDAVQGSNTITALQEKTITTGILAKIDPRLKTRNSARILVTVNGITDEINRTVNRMMQLLGSKQTLDLLNGSGSLQVTTVNTSTVRTPKAVTATLQINGRDVDTQNLGFISAGATQETALHFTAVDPLDLIHSQIQVSVVLKMGDLHSDQTIETVAIGDVNEALVDYFNGLANNRAFSPISKGRDRQIDLVTEELVSENNEETRALKKGKNQFKKNPDSTIVGDLVKTFEANVQTSDAKNRYHKLAVALWPARKNLKNFLFFGGKRKSYEKLLQRIAQSDLK